MLGRGCSEDDAFAAATLCPNTVSARPPTIVIVFARWSVVQGNATGTRLVNSILSLARGRIRSGIGDLTPKFENLLVSLVFTSYLLLPSARSR